MNNATANPRPSQRSKLVGHIAAVEPIESGPGPSDGEIIEAVLLLRRALRSNTRATVRALLSELGHLRRVGRRELRRAS